MIHVSDHENMQITYEKHTKTMQNHHVHLILFRFDAGSLAKLKLQEACDHGEQLTLPADLSHHALLLQMSFGHHLGGCSSPSAASKPDVYIKAFAHSSAAISCHFNIYFQCTTYDFQRKCLEAIAP